MLHFHFLQFLILLILAERDIKILTSVNADCWNVLICIMASKVKLSCPIEEHRRGTHIFFSSAYQLVLDESQGPSAVQNLAFDSQFPKFYIPWSLLNRMKPAGQNVPSLDAGAHVCSALIRS